MPAGRHAFGDAVIESKVYLVPTRGRRGNGITVQLSWACRERRAVQHRARTKHPGLV